MGVEPIIISDEDAKALRDAVRAERMAVEALELVTLRHRVALHEAKSMLAAVLDTLADTYGFDSTTAHEFDYATRTLTKKG